MIKPLLVYAFVCLQLGGISGENDRFFNVVTNSDIINYSRSHLLNFSCWGYGPNKTELTDESFSEEGLSLVSPEELGYIGVNICSRLITTDFASDVKVGDKETNTSYGNYTRKERNPDDPIRGTGHILLGLKIGILVFLGGAFTKYWFRLQSVIWRVRSGYPALMLCWAIGWSVGMFIIVVAGGLWAVI